MLSLMLHPILLPIYPRSMACLPYLMTLTFLIQCLGDGDPLYRSAGPGGCGGFGDDDDDDDDDADDDAEAPEPLP